MAVAAPRPTEFDLATGRAFDALMWALSRPGEAIDGGLGLEDIAACLLDLEVTFFAPSGPLADRLARTGAREAPLAEADYAFLPSLGAGDLAGLADLPVGDHLYPDAGATLIIGAEIGAGTQLRLTGPGIPGGRRVDVGGVPAGFWELRGRACAYPLGWDVFIVDCGRVAGLPRSTMIEVC